MRSSPRRPLILRRRRLNLPNQDGAETPAQTAVIASQTPDCGGLDDPKPETPELSFLPAPSSAPRSPSASRGLSGVKVMGHPTIPDTQLVIIPPDSDVESIIQALTVRGKESGGPNKFILLTGNSSLHSQVERLGLQSKAQEIETLELEAASGAASLPHTPEKEEAPPVDGQELDDSLTNIHWLGKMSSDRLGPQDPKTDAAEKENCSPERDPVKEEEEPPAPAASQSWPSSAHERPPYSYMALIQFAINSTASKRMTLKDIYTWIEDHFPYFKHVAKPGWKNSIRHNLSLHDMFVRETPSNNKISYWTIHPQANRCLTLDQVFKASGPSSSSSSACSDPRPVTPEPSSVGQSLVGSARAPERKMKPLLPRIDSYLIPVQFPLAQPLIFSPLETFAPDLGAVDGPRSSKRVRIAPKILLRTSVPSPPVLAAPPQAEPDPAELRPALLAECRRVSRSRRKQQLVTPGCQEPELVLPDSSCASDSGLDTEFSLLQDTHPPVGPSQLTHDEGYSFKTPVKDKFMNPPASSTPSRLPCLQPSESPSALTRDPLLDFSPVRIPRGAALTPFKDSYGALSFWETPFKDLPYFGSPPDVMATSSPPSSPQLETLETPTGVRKQRRCSKELQVGGSTNRSLLEGLVLDTKDESLSKILLDISFSGLEEEDPGTDSSYWGQLFNELR